MTLSHIKRLLLLS